LLCGRIGEADKHFRASTLNLPLLPNAALLKPFYKLVYLAAARKGGLFDVL
jgi:hypothetical protein